jgi:hypothetical protein
MKLHGVLNRLLSMCTILLLCLVSMPGSVLGADVDVYAEGAYTDTDLVLYIYADITPHILSYGVKVIFETSELTLTSAEKNEDVWFFGDGSTNHPYMEPETATPGEVIIIGGKLDTAAPTAGVTGERVLLGKVIFTRTGSAMPFSPTLSLDFARGGDYENFVQTDGETLDDTGVSFNVTIAERGDSNHNGIFDTGDMFVVRTYLQNGEYSCIVDCNVNGLIDTGDMFCIKGKIGG